jgi:hypothetical protein
VASERFRASVQYNDFKGTAAADRADGNGGPENWLKARGLMTADEFILGIDIWVGENRAGAHEDPITANFLIVPGAHDEAEKMVKTSGDIRARQVTVDVTIAEFLGLFKRFSVAFSPDGMLTDKSVTITENHRE